MINEPITFDPAVKEIVRELGRLAARVRARLGQHGAAAAGLRDAA